MMGRRVRYFFRIFPLSQHVSVLFLTPLPHTYIRTQTRTRTHAHTYRRANTTFFELLTQFENALNSPRLLIYAPNGKEKCPRTFPYWVVWGECSAHRGYFY